MAPPIKRNFLIAEDMWRDYQRILEEVEMLNETDEDSEQELSAFDEWDDEDDY